MGPALLAQVAVNALVLSSMYILMALGFAILLSVMRVLNFAHAVIYMGGGYVCYQLAVVYGLNQWASLVVAASVMGLFGLFLERFCLRPFFGDVNRTIVMTLALIVILERYGITRSIAGGKYEIWIQDRRIQRVEDRGDIERVGPDRV